MPCNLTKEQADEFFKDPVRRSALWDAAVDRYYKKGADYVKTVQGLAADTGFPKESIQKALQPNGVPRSITNEMWAKQYAKRAIGQHARNMAENTGGNAFQKAYNAYDSFNRRVATLGHFTVLGKTHLGDSLFTNPVEYARNFKNSAGLLKGMSAHELRMNDMFTSNDLGVNGGDYKLAMRSGLDVTAKNEARSLLGGSKSPRAHAAFEELQLRRFEKFKQAMGSLPEEERTADNGKPIAAVINNRTGGGVPGRIGGFFGKFLFGARLTPAQWRAAFGDNINAVYNGILNRGAASPGDLKAARMTGARMGKLFAVYGSALGLEAAYSAYFGDKRNMPNFTNWKDTSTWLRPKIAGVGVPVSPTVELISLPMRMILGAYSAKPGESRLVKFAEPLVKYTGYRLSPGLALAATVGLNQETFSGRPLPFQFQSPYANGQFQSPVVNRQPQLTKSGQPAMSELTHPQLNYTEFLGERLPIPLAVFVRDAYDEMRSDGMDHPTAVTLLKSGLAAATTGVGGYEWHPERTNAYTMAEANTPPNASDKDKARILRQAQKDFKAQRSSQPEPKEAFGIGQ